MRDEENLEAEIQAKGLNAPRLTPALIDSKITSADYYVFPGTTLTICALTLVNGFQVTGESAAASPENFNVEIGRKIAYENARQKIWALEGYLLRERLASGFADPVMIDRGTLGSATHALKKFCPEEAHNTILELRQVTMGHAYRDSGTGEFTTAADAAARPNETQYETLSYDHSTLTYRNAKGDKVPDNEVVRHPKHGAIRMTADTVLGESAGKLIGHDRSEEGAPSFKG